MEKRVEDAVVKGVLNMLKPEDIEERLRKRLSEVHLPLGPGDSLSFTWKLNIRYNMKWLDDGSIQHGPLVVVWSDDTDDKPKED